MHLLHDVNSFVLLTLQEKVYLRYHIPPNSYSHQFFLLYLVLHCRILRIYNMCIYLHKGKEIFLLNDVNKNQALYSNLAHLRADELYTERTNFF